MLLLVSDGTCDWEQCGKGQSPITPAQLCGMHQGRIVASQAAARTAPVCALHEYVALGKPAYVARRATPLPCHGDESCGLQVT
eukprot:4384395-Amphidinium_carterae.1